VFGARPESVKDVAVGRPTRLASVGVKFGVSERWTL
jgi:hypothetical protein